MARTFKHLRIRERLLLRYFYKRGYSKAAIAKELGVHRSTVYRELTRNHDPHFGYHILIAEDKARQRQRDQKQRKLDRRPEYKEYVIEKLRDGWSPEQIVGRMRLIAGRSISSHETLYSYIYSEQGIKEGLYRYLRRQRPKRYPKVARKKRSMIPNRVCITQRPEHINNRSEFGHWEADFLQFKIGIKTSLLTLRERKSRYLIAIKQPNHQPNSVAECLINHLQWPYQPHKGHIKSITFDNDIGFKQHEKIATAFNAKTYFCEPYKSYQKGSIENGNRSLREFFPRTLDPTFLEQKQIEKYIDRLNARPMKCLNYRTSYEILRLHTE